MDNLTKSDCRNQPKEGDDRFAQGNAKEIKMHAVIYAHTLLRHLAKSKAGAVATEYAFLIAFISIVAAIGMVLLGDNLSGFFNDIGIALGFAADKLDELPFGS